MPDSGNVSVISKMQEVDPVFAEVVDLLYGDAVDVRQAWDIAKANDGSEMHVNSPLKIKAARKALRRVSHPKGCDCQGCCVAKAWQTAEARESAKAKKERTQARVGLASNVVGLAAGGAALYSAAKDDMLRGKMGHIIVRAKRVTPRTKALAAGAAGLQAANLGGDLVANRVLLREAKKDVAKSLDEIVALRRSGQITTDQAIALSESVAKAAGKHAQSRASLTARAEMAEHALKTMPRANKRLLLLTGATGLTAGFAGGRKSKKPAPAPAPVAKREDELVDYVYTGEISKMDEDKRLVFGWCSLSTVDGKPVVDLQGDYAPIEEIEKSAYAYVVKSRVGGDMHRREGEKALHVSDLVESFIATPEKLAQMGVPEEVAKSMPTGWWVGYHVSDDEIWAKVKSGERAGFSIHGKGSRVKKSLEGAA